MNLIPLGPSRLVLPDFMQFNALNLANHGYTDPHITLPLGAV